MKVTATVEIEFEVPPTADLNEAYVGVAADLFTAGGDLLGSARDCETESVVREPGVLIHPVAVGTRVVSLTGEVGDTDTADDMFTGANAAGTIVAAGKLSTGKWSYMVEFVPSGVVVFLDENDLADTQTYVCE